jgi:hypothetical protein
MDFFCAGPLRKVSRFALEVTDEALFYLSDCGCHADFGIPDRLYYQSGPQALSQSPLIAADEAAPHPEALWQQSTTSLR